MDNDYIRVKVYDPIKKKYIVQDYQCSITEIYKLDDSTRFFSINLPYNQIVIQGDDEEDDGIKNDIDSELDKIHYELEDFLECVDESMDYQEDKKYDREQVEKLRVLRAKLENITLEFCDIM